MKDDADIGALMKVIEESQSAAAMRGFLTLLSEANAGTLLASAVARMITDLFGGSNPRAVAEAARGALALHGVTKRQGPGADLLTRTSPAA